MRTRRSDRAWTAQDFLRKRRSDETVLPAALLPTLLDAFAAAHNRRIAKA